MVEKIEVAYKPVIGPEGFIAYHKYILYTNSAGEQFYARGGWEFNPLGEPDFRLVTEEGAYVDGTKDFDPSINNPNLIKHPAETVTAGDDLSTKWQGIKDAIADIGSRNIPYDFKDANSNATVDEALRTAGVPQALRDGPSDLWAPGSDYNLPGGDVGPNNGNFGEESSEFLRKKFRDLNEKFNDLKEKIKDFFDDAKDFVLRRDPLTLDLDGDGLETTGIAATNPIQFDHDGDGIKNGTGWVLSDDAFLVLDKNGNGTIDSGRELFGDSTIKSNGQTAVDGFDALADLDSLSNGGNADGKISNLDSQFANLRLWRDLNQDGISQTGELFTLTQLNISSINVTKTANSQTLPNGNQIADLGTFTRTDGATGNVGAVTGNMADINLASDTFHRTFPNVLDTSSVATLPDMQGSGAVRDLREAANDTGWRVVA